MASSFYCTYPPKDINYKPWAKYFKNYPKILETGQKLAEIEEGENLEQVKSPG